MGMGERIKDMRISVGLTQEELANRLNLQKSAIAKYENGRVKNIKRTTILKMSEIFGCSPSYLMDMEDPTPDPLLSNIHPVATRSFPVLSSIACGEPILMQEEKEVYVDASEEIHADFCLIAKGDSMVGARIYDGDIVFIRQQPIVENGEIAAVAIDDEATLKRFYKYDELIVLRPENPEYKEMQFKPDDGRAIKILGKAIAFQGRLR